jgi:hypothetical protein
VTTVQLHPGESVINQRLGNFRVQLQREEPDGHQATITASVLGPPGLSERQRSSGNHTLKLAMSADQAMDLAAKVLRCARDKGLPLPPGISIAP